MGKGQDGTETTSTAAVTVEPPPTTLDNPKREQAQQKAFGGTQQPADLGGFGQTQTADLENFGKLRNQQAPQPPPESEPAAAPEPPVQQPRTPKPLDLSGIRAQEPKKDERLSGILADDTAHDLRSERVSMNGAVDKKMVSEKGAFGLPKLKPIGKRGVGRRNWQRRGDSVWSHVKVRFHPPMLGIQRHREEPMTTQNVTAKTGTVVDAIEFGQSGYRMYIVCLTAQQLISGTVVDPYDSELEAGDSSQGYQRPPERSRITRIGNYLIQNLKAGKGGIYPTAILLAARETFTFRSNHQTIAVAAWESLTCN